MDILDALNIQYKEQFDNYISSFTHNCIEFKIYNPYYHDYIKTTAKKRFIKYQHKFLRESLELFLTQGKSANFNNTIYTEEALLNAVKRSILFNRAIPDIDIDTIAPCSTRRTIYSSAKNHQKGKNDEYN